MAQRVVEPEYKGSKKKKKQSKEPSKIPPPVPVYLQDFAPPSQAMSTLCLAPQSQPLSAPVRPCHLDYHSHLGNLPKQSVGNSSPQCLFPYGQNAESASSQHFLPLANQPTTPFASPQNHKPNEVSLRKRWDKIDRMAAKSYSNLRDSAGKGMTKMAANYIERPTHLVATKSMQTLCKGAALCDIVSSKFDAVITSIDDEKFSGKEQDLIIYEDQRQQQQLTISPPLGQSEGLTSSYMDPNLGEQKGSNHFSKVWLYSNSRLPPHLPPFKVYMPTYPLLCLAATYSERVYTPPGSNTCDMETHIPADWRSGTKAMVLKAIPVEELNTIIFAIRGSQTFMDWAVNYNSAPSSPQSFLDDPANLCHAGFLYVAKKMVKPVADRLKVLLQENPARSNCSLLITGHSAGGAVAALLYAHMMSTKIKSELSYLTGFFKRVHCITFGAPPVSVRALKKPEDIRHRKSLFYSFINEGDPIPRADKNMLRSLLKLYTTPAPNASALASAVASMSKLNTPHTVAPASLPTKSRIRLMRPLKASLETGVNSASNASITAAPTWPIPPSTLSPAGRIVVLRQMAGSRSEDDVEAVTADDEMLRKVVYGDLLKHQMRVYKRRIDSVATRAVTGNAS